MMGASIRLDEPIAVIRSATVLKASLALGKASQIGQLLLGLQLCHPPRRNRSRRDLGALIRHLADEDDFLTLADIRFLLGERPHGDWQPTMVRKRSWRPRPGVRSADADLIATLCWEASTNHTQDPTSSLGDLAGALFGPTIISFAWA